MWSGIICGPRMRRNLPVYFCEFAGTAIMLFVGVTAVALMWAPASPMPVVPNPMLRRLITGIMFAAGATAVVYSPLGQRSGGHINPAVTLAFWRAGKVPTRDAVAYVIAQFAGALAGAFAAGLAWRELTPAVQYAATTPGEGYSTIVPLGAATSVTFLPVFTIFVSAGETVMREGELGAEAYIIERGVLEVLRDRSQTTPIPVAQLVKGDWVGEISLLLDEPRTATVIALSDAQLRRVTREDFGRIL